MSEARKSMAYSRSPLLQVITSSKGDISHDYTTFTELLRKLSEPPLGAKSLVRTEENNIYLVTLIPTEAKSKWTSYDAITEAKNYFATGSNKSHLSFQFTAGTEQTKQSLRESSHLLVISRYDKPISASQTWSYDDDVEECDLLNEKAQGSSRLTSWIPLRFKSKYMLISDQSGREPLKKHLMTWIVISIIALAIVVSVSYALNNIHHYANKSWIRYPTPRSEGPRYQLEFNHKNVSSWAAANPTASDEYYIRVDDGCMFAPHLVDEQELRYQRLLETRYPQLHDLRMQRKYLDEGFLGDPFAIQIQVDNAFHLGHCVIAIRRYWWARETGKHVCPKDLDFRHIRHCLDVFDSWVFPDEFPQHKHGQDDSMDVAANETELDDGWDMNKPAWFVWKQEVCF